jgi:alkylation response protein AidB-like acyl-CoA dehydrogenase
MPDSSISAGLETAGVETWLERARALAPAIEAAADNIESEGRLPAGLLQRLHDARMFRMLLPRSLGGAEMSPAAFSEVLETLASIDASTAWMIGQGSGCSLAAAYLAPDIARELFGADDAVLAWGPPGPGGKADAVEGGYRLTGRWSFASGNRHAQWLGAHISITEPDGTLRLGANGKPVERTLLLPRKAARVEDTWQVLGLLGTGSDTYSVEDLFVPEKYSFQRESDVERREMAPLYRFTGINLFGFSVASISHGIARSMLAAFIRLAQSKSERTTGQSIRDNARVQTRVAVAEAKLRSSRAFMRETARELYAIAEAGQPFPMEARVRMRLATTWAAQQAREVADFAYTAAGTAAILENGPFERRFRDIHTVSQQVQAHEGNYELVGQSLLGVPVASRLM